MTREVFCVSHGLKGPNVFVVFASFIFLIGASLLTCSRQLSYRCMNVRAGRVGVGITWGIFDT